MSKARLVITAVIAEGRSQSEVGRTYGVSQSWISRLVKRYHLEGEGAFQPRSRRPHTNPTRLPQTTIDLIACGSGSVRAWVRWVASRYRNDPKSRDGGDLKFRL